MQKESLLGRKTSKGGSRSVLEKGDKYRDACVLWLGTFVGNVHTAHFFVHTLFCVTLSGEGFPVFFSAQYFLLYADFDLILYPFLLS